MEERKWKCEGIAREREDRTEWRKERRKEGNKPCLFLSWVSFFFPTWGRRQCQWLQPSPWISSAVNTHHSGCDPEHKMCKEMRQFDKIGAIFHFLAVSQREITKPLSPVSFQEGGWNKSPRATTEGFFLKKQPSFCYYWIFTFFKKSNNEPKKNLSFYSMH